MRHIIAICSLCFLIAAPSWASAKSNLLFILDASNSMWGQVDGVAKIETAKTAFNNLVTDIPDDVHVGLAAYGHREKESCKDYDFLTAFVDKANRNMLTEAMSTIKPKGKTPIARSLELLGTAMAKEKEGDSNSIVLISDGVETCEGDPCAVAEKLAMAGGNLDVRVHVVGFDISQEDRKQLECIAEKGKGQYFSTDSTEGFNDAVAKVVQVATAEPPPAPEPEKPAQSEIFRDDFDGDELAEHWEIVNPDPDSFIVENGKLTAISNQKAALTDENLKNLFLLNQELPKGDWIITTRFNMPIQTTHEIIDIGIYGGPDKQISAAMYYDKPAQAKIAISVVKQSGGERTYFERKLINQYDANGVVDFYNQRRPFDLQLIKEGREYRAKVTSAADGETIYETPVLTQLRPFGRPFIAFRNFYNVSGEATVDIDWFKIEAAE